MDFKLTLYVLALFTIQLVLGQVGAPCHNQVFTFTPRHSLNLTEFQGRWYAHEYASSYRGNTPKPEYKCLSINLIQTSETLLNFKESSTNITTGIIVEDEGSIAVNATRSPLNAVWKLSTPSLPWTVDMMVMSADLTFSRWAILYSCQIRDGNFRWETLMAVTRSHTLDPVLRSDLKALMVGGGFHLADHWPIEQTGCLI